MKMHRLFSIVFTLLALSWTHNAVAQNDSIANYVGSQIEVETDQGYEIRGLLQEASDSSIVLITDYGEVKIARSKIVEFRVDDYTGEFRFPNPHTTRYFFGPSATQLKRGEGYYQNLLVSGNFVNVGITNHFSMGAGFEFISLVNGTPIGFLTPKFGVPISEHWSISTGALIVGGFDLFSGALPYAVSTYTYEEASVTFGAGIWTDFDEFYTETPAFLISGTQRVTNSVALLTENYIIAGEGETLYFGIHGIRILSEKNAFDIGILVLDEVTDGIPLPFVGYARRF